MKTEVMEKILDAIKPKMVQRYLVHTGWIHQRVLPTNVSIWDNLLLGENGIRVWIPDSETLPDYSRMTERAMRTVAGMEKRSVNSLLEDLQTVAIGDVVRVSSESSANTLGFNDCISLLQRAYNMKVSAANSENLARPVHHSKMDAPVQNFAERILVGQTEPDGYTVKLISPIAEDGSSDTSFSRRAITRMTKSLDRLNDISREAVLKDSYHFDPFRDSVDLGVSANLCEAVAEYNGDVNTPLRITVTWGYMDEVHNTNPQTAYCVKFHPQQMIYLRTAANQFRQEFPEM